MSDREFLELAAKAAGKQLADPIDSYIPSGGLWVVGRAGMDEVWSPLTDDGDCARLEANLGIDVQWLNKSVTCQRLAIGLASVSLLFSRYAGDKATARRYASVMCAAEIGRAMP